MGERKVFDKYYPPNFDPNKIPRIQKPKNHQKKVRSMLPFSIRCNTCGSYISAGTKFNCREEQVIGETYLGIKILRFYFKCTNCCTELILKTDPQWSSYVVESGATRTNGQHEEEEKEAEESEEDAISSLEKRTLVSERGIEVMAALDEMKSMKSRRMSASVDSMLKALSRRDKEEQSKEEEDVLIKSIRFGKQRRIVEEEETDEKMKKKRRMEPLYEKILKTNRFVSGESLSQISYVRVITSKKKKMTSLGLASLCNKYETDEET